MITPSFAPTATERVLPKLALDFTTASLDSRVTFTRVLNTATVVNSSGYVVSINANLPRFDYSPTTLACNGLLIEESRINIMDYSNGSYAHFVNGWFNTGSLTGSVTAPDNSSSAEQYTFAAGTASNYKVMTVTASTNYSWSFYYKVGTYLDSEVLIAIYNATAGSFIVSDITPTKTAMRDGWVRATYSFATPVGCTSIRTYLLRKSGSTGGTISWWGVQLEAGAFATSYIPNVATGTTTRNADVATMTGTNFSSWFNAAQGAFAASATTTSAAGTTQRIFSASTGSYADSISSSTSGTDLYCQVWTGTALQANLFFAGGAGNTTFKLGFAYKANSTAAALKGGAVSTDNTVTLPTVNQLGIGNEGGFAFFNGWIQNIRYWPQRLIDAEVQAFSK